uniref:Uncharacterized protein n=1 Tax=Candidatus Kentrum sp. LPFa TaxID=2126335 RepID=A0A450X7J5_9GAMM|nr:MAG: hypothetical protein BECKLPF1236A_GA0070988_100212 [Candidatus Kentron sp. LPFa]VFK25223.1 MAG: hypothetical protein BECKLPF1236C_GA0070990_100202 [Candidatus Kentron sp. LPFa]
MKLKFTCYFLVTRQRPDRAGIELSWIEAVVAHPIETRIQNDGCIRKWGFVNAVRKYLRVILLEDGETVHNVFFDRNFEEHKP